MHGQRPVSGPSKNREAATWITFQFDKRFERIAQCSSIVKHLNTYSKLG